MIFKKVTNLIKDWELKKYIKNLKLLLTMNKENIIRMVVSEDFITSFQQKYELLDIEKTVDEKTEVENWFLFGVPLVESYFLPKGAILEMSNGEFIVLKSIEKNKKI